MIETVRRRRVEVLVDQPLVPTIEKRAEESGIEHFTVLRALSGRGHTGQWTDDQLSGAIAKRLFLAVTKEEDAERFVNAITPLLDSHGLVLFLSDVEVVRGDRY